MGFSLRTSARVIEIKDASQFTDHKPRVCLRFEDADVMDRQITVPVSADDLSRLSLGEQFGISINSTNVLDTGDASRPRMTFQEVLAAVRKIVDQCGLLENSISVQCDYWRHRAGRQTIKLAVYVCDGGKLHGSIRTESTDPVALLASFEANLKEKLNEGYDVESLGDVPAEKAEAAHQ